MNLLTPVTSKSLKTYITVLLMAFFFIAGRLTKICHWRRRGTSAELLIQPSTVFVPLEMPNEAPLSFIMFRIFTIVVYNLTD